MIVAGGGGGRRIKSIQRGTFTTPDSGSAAGSGNVIIAPVNLNRSFLTYKAVMLGTEQGSNETCTHEEMTAAMLLRISNSSTLSWVNAKIRVGSTSQASWQLAKVAWEVVEYE